MPGRTLEPSQVVLDVVGRLDAHREEIALAWAEAIRREMASTFYGQRPLAEIRRLNLLGLELIKSLLLGANPQSSASLFDTVGIASIAPVYWREGLALAQIEKAVSIAKEILIPQFVAGLPAGDRARGEALLRLEACLSQFAATMVGLYATLVTRHLEEQRRSTELMLMVARTVSSSTDLSVILAEAAKGIALAVGGGHCWICVVDDKGSLTHSAATEGFPAPVAQQLVQAGQSLLVSRLLREQRVIVWHDLQEDAAADEDSRALGLRTVLGVPCVAGERVLGAALVASVEAPQSFTPEQVELALGVARVVAPAVDNARLLRCVEQTAIMEERARLAREIHDNLAQVLGAMQIRASLTEELLEQARADEALVSLGELQSLVSEAYGGARDAIFSLRAMVSPGASFSSALREYLADYRSYYGGEIHVDIEDEAAASLGRRAGVQAIRIVQEALTNARKHARARRVWVRVQRRGAGVRISVKDDGAGFELDRVSKSGQLHVGLQVMRERAVKIGGDLCVESTPGTGTHVVLDLPLANEVEG